VVGGGAAAARRGANPPPHQELRFESTFTSALPGDPVKGGPVRQMQGVAYSFVDPTPAGGSPVTLAAAECVARSLGLDPASLTTDAFARLFSGDAVPPGAHPYAACYGGHQFGSWAGQLGDGRAICLGDVRCPDGARREVQLKGAGRTPYSRFADGRAVLRSSLREFVASEAVAALGIPTTRALSLVLTGAGVERDQFYDGRPALELGAVVARVSECFVRFGSFELPASRGDFGLVKQLADFMIQHHYGTAGVAAGDYEALLNAILTRNADTVAAWQAVGFVHGVLNTDNMSALGETIDSG